MRPKLILRSGGVFLLLPILGCARPLIVTTTTLLNEMTDLAALAEFPDPAYTCRQYSSYDRRSTSPDDHESWFANADRGNYLREEQHDGRTEFVLMDADGPGAIVRFWSANPHGMLRFYLDGDERPTLEVPMDDFLGGKLKDIPDPISAERSHGWSSYLPIPYRKHCKVTGDEIRDGKNDVYYQINYRTYQAGTHVQTFRKSDLAWHAARIRKQSLRLADPEKYAVRAAIHRGRGLETAGRAEPRLVIEPGQEVVLRSGADGLGGAITEFVVRVFAKQTDAALRGLVLTIDFDNERTVECPLGDFFGAAPGVNPYASLPLGVTESGEMWSHWFMPFAQSARVALRNHSEESVGLAYSIGEILYPWSARTMHFHAKWRQARQVPTRPMRDWNYLDTRGRGVFAGVAFSIANPVKQWWGEGDEKIYVDDEEFPSHFGTGTEDYFGYAWSSNTPFSHAYHNQPRCDGPGNFGHTSVNRWHILDRIPFENHFRFDMELWHWTKNAKVDMSVVSYWYARLGATDAFPPVRGDELALVALPAYTPPRVEGAIEGEELRVIESTAEAGPQHWDTLSNESHLWWRHGEPGDRLVLGFPVEQAGRYRVYARLVRAIDYGIHRLAINNEPAGEPIDLYHDGVEPTDEIVLGVFNLNAGENRLSVTIDGANDAAVKSYMFGLDYLRIEPVE